MRRLGLRDLIVWLLSPRTLIDTNQQASRKETHRLGSMDKVRKLDRILNEENGDIIPNYVPIPFICIELDGKAADVADGIGRSSRSRDG